MSEEDFQFTLEYPIDAATLYEQFATEHGVRNWWTTHCTMDARVGGEAYFPFSDADFYAKATIHTLSPDKEIAWNVTDCRHPENSGWTDLHDWVGTTIHFWIDPIDNNRSRLVFKHEGLLPLECADSCSSLWRFYLGQSLLNFFKTGKGEAYQDKQSR